MKQTRAVIPTLIKTENKMLNTATTPEITKSLILIAIT